LEEVAIFMEMASPDNSRSVSLESRHWLMLPHDPLSLMAIENVGKNVVQQFN
jgi:hypothetical protein